MKPPGLASAAPAPTIATAGEVASFLIRSIIAWVLAGSLGRRHSRSA